MQNIKFAKSMKDFQNKERSSFKRQTLEGVEKWKKHIKNNPDDYKNMNIIINLIYLFFLEFCLFLIIILLTFPGLFIFFFL